jgi:hypothetical protein
VVSKVVPKFDGELAGDMDKRQPCSSANHCFNLDCRLPQNKNPALSSENFAIGQTLRTAYFFP